MQLSQLKITRLRNILEANLSLDPKVNLFFGENGSGKTSVLEAIFLLVSGKSFRTSRQDEAIQFCTPSYVISGVAEARREGGCSTRMGVERTKGGGQKLRVNDQLLDKVAELAKILPVQLLNIDSYRFLEEGPLCRRQFMDWGVFHVEHSFSSVWQRYNRALQQRNAALKAIKGIKTPPDLQVHPVRIWEQELCEMGHWIDLFRQEYLSVWIPLFSRILKDILGIDLNVQYKRGWGSDKALSLALEEAFVRDRLCGYTTLGPHRADLGFFVGEVPLKAILSRGQLKLFVCALLLARAELLFTKTQKKCVFMIDDLHAELDAHAAEILVHRLGILGAQTIITGIERDALRALFEGQEYQMFHVEQGMISALEKSDRNVSC
jgi:DNA replication and repair protein RecF